MRWPTTARTAGSAVGRISASSAPGSSRSSASRKASHSPRTSSQAAVAGVRDAAVGRQPEQDDARVALGDRRHQIGRAIGRGIVDDDDLERDRPFREHRIEGALDGRRGVPGRHQDRESGRIRPARRRGTGGRLAQREGVLRGSGVGQDGWACRQSRIPCRLQRQKGGYSSGRVVWKTRPLCWLIPLRTSPVSPPRI